MRSQIIILLVAFVGLSSCREDAPLPPSETTPDFYAKASVDGVQTSVSAGVDNYYMHTDYTVSEGIPQLIGDLKADGNQDLAWKFEFFSKTDDGTVDVDEVLALGDKTLRGEYGFNDSEGIVAIEPSIFINGNLGEVPQSYWWEYQQGLEPEPEPTFLLDTVDWDGKQPIVSINARAIGRDMKTLRCIDVRHPESVASFKYEIISQGILLCYLDPEDQVEMESMVWHINNNFVKNGDSLLYRISVESPHEINVSAGFRHNNGARTCMGQRIFLNFPNFDPPSLDFRYESGPYQETDSVQLNSLRVSLLRSGIVYSTDLHIEPGNVTIEEVTDYSVDNSGRPTKKIRISGSFLLSDATGKEVRVEDADFAIAVATSDP